MKPNVLVIGLGNLILTDDGVGVHALRYFREQAPRFCLAVEVGTAVLSAIHLLERADHILAFDAMQAGGPPGSVYALHASDVLDEGVRHSLHEMGLISVLKTLRKPLSGVVVIAAEPEIIDWGTNLSGSVAAAVPIMVQTARVVLARWAAEIPSDSWPACAAGCRSHDPQRSAD